MGLRVLMEGVKGFYNYRRKKEKLRVLNLEMKEVDRYVVWIGLSHSKPM